MEELKRQLTEMANGVEKFHREVLDLPIHPGRLPDHRKAFRAKFLQEELEEYHQSDDVADEVDALVDLVYVAIGALLEMGVRPIDAFREVQERNMAKLRGETERGEAYDAIKPAGWYPPDHVKVLVDLELRANVRPALLEATRIMLERGAKYNGGSVRRIDHFPLGMTSIFDILWLKMTRMRSDIERKEPVDRDHLRDMINYAGFGIDIIDGRDLG